MFEKSDRQKTVPMLRYWTHRYVLVLLCSLLILAVVSALWLQASAYEHLYSLLELQADQLADAYTQSGNNFLFSERLRYTERIRPRFPDRVVQLADKSGNVLTVKNPKGTDFDNSALYRLSPLNSGVLKGKKIREKLEVDSQTWLRVGVPIIEGGVVTKALYVSMPARNVLLETQRLYLALALLTGIITLVGWMVLYYISRRLTRPLREISAAARTIAGGRYDPVLPVNVKEKELQQLVASFDNMARQLKQLEQLRTDLLAGVSHELRTPITSIRGMIQAVRDKVVSGDEAEEFLNITLNESKRLQLMVEELLDFSSFEAGAVPINKREINMNSLVEEVIRQIGKSPDYSEVLFESDTSGGEVRLLGDAGRLRQVLINIYSNSRKASATEIKTSLNSENGMAVIEVADNGKGVDPKDLPYIFERFYRGFPGKSSKHGLGLGLTISRLLVRAHGGDLVLLNTDTGGTTFRISIPQKEKSLG